jgi:hypothetical protein
LIKIPAVNFCPEITNQSNDKVNGIPFHIFIKTSVDRIAETSIMNGARIDIIQLYRSDIKRLSKNENNGSRTASKRLTSKRPEYAAAFWST